MDIEFTSQEELYKRVKPALRTKRMELYRLGFNYIKEEDIWNYLKTTKWIYGKNLELSDIVNDIIHLNNQKIDNYVKEELKKIKKEPFFDGEII